MSEALSCEVLSWADLTAHDVELLPARTVLSCWGGGSNGGDGGGDSGGGDFNINENTNTNTNTATATATVIPEGGLLAALLG